MGEAYAAALTATPFIAGGKITWSIKSGSLPKGITLDAAKGTLSGMPAAKGSYTFKVSASETNGGTAEKSLSIRVTMDPPTVTTASLPNGTADKEYSVKLAATPYTKGKAITWSISSGSLPYGLYLDSQTGGISGTPEFPGTNSFTVCASEADGEKAYKELSLTVEQKPIALTEDPCIVLSYSGDDTLRDNGEYSIYLYTDRDPGEDETVTGVLEYTDKNNNEKAFEFTPELTYSCCAYYRGELPEDAGKINSFKFAVGGKIVAVSEIDLEVAPVLTISFSGDITSGADPYLWVMDENDDVVYSQAVSGTTEPVTLKNLPEGRYTLETQGFVTEYGDLSFGSAEAVLTNGKTTNVTLKLTDHRALQIRPQPKAGDKTVGWWGRSFAWYSDAEGTQLISTADNYSVLDDETVYLRVSPKDSYSVDYTDSELVKVTLDTEKYVSVPFTRKAAVTAEITASAEDRGGSGVFDESDFWITAARPGAGNYVSASRDRGYAGKTYIAENITEGTVITVSARNGFSGSEDQSSVTHTVTAAEIAAGKVKLNAAIPVNEGRIYLDVTCRTLEGTSKKQFRDISGITITKADGSELAYRKTDSALILTEPEKVSAGETVTVYAKTWNNTFGPDSDGEAKLTVRQDAQGKKYLKGSLEMPRRRTVYLTLRRTVTGPMTMLVYKGDGSLLKANSELLGGTNAQRTTANIYVGGLLPDKYTFVLVDSRHFAALAPEDYDRVSEGRSLPYSGFDETDLTENDGSISVKLGNDAVAREYSSINKDLSNVTMKKTYSSCVSLDMTVVPKPSFAPDGNVTIRIETNQPQNDLNAGAVSTYALSVNGFPIDIDRWNTNNAGLIQKDGSIQLTLTGEMLEAFGGFPLEFSTVFRETNYESLSCSAYLIFDQGSTHSVDYIGSFEEETGFITVEAPEFTADGEFTVWGTAMPSAVGSQYYTADKHTDYNVTLFADGMPVAQTRSDRKGNFKAKVLINTEGLKEYEGIEFTASGSYADGSFARVSDPVTTLYTPNDGVLKKYEIFWENHKGDAENGRMQSMVILDDGDPVSLDLLWYRGAINSDDQARVQWKMTFDNPDDITSVTVDVPRNGYVQTIDAVKQEDGTWLTPLTYIPGSAPDGTTVSYSVKTKPAHLIRKDDSDFTDEQFRSVYNRLASTSLISGLTVAESSMTFKLAGKNKTLPVSVTSKELDWDKEEAEDLDSFEPVFIYGEEEGDLLPNVILSQEGWFEGRLVDGFEGDEYVFGTRTINKYTDDPGTVYISRVLTATRCVTVVWDTANKKKFMTVIDIGGNVQHDPGINK